MLFSWFVDHPEVRIALEENKDKQTYLCVNMEEISVAFVFIKAERRLSLLVPISAPSSPQSSDQGFEYLPSITPEAPEHSKW